ncbi:MAG: hypothetical protein MAG581_01733 [Deltaproteobacteria bacterium]|nr:hypothetical protein [Deltaproteobacteria bacterium]
MKNSKDPLLKISLKVFMHLICTLYKRKTGTFHAGFPLITHYKLTLIINNK